MWKMTDRLKAQGYEIVPIQLKLRKNMYYWMIDCTAIGQFETHEEATKVRDNMTKEDGCITITHQGKETEVRAEIIDIMHKEDYLEDYLNKEKRAEP